MATISAHNALSGTAEVRSNVKRTEHSQMLVGDVHGARGGAFIAGGMAQKIESFLVQSAFRTRFENKGRLSGFVKAIPTRLIVNSDASLLGAARAALELRR